MEAVWAWLGLGMMLVWTPECVHSSVCDKKGAATEAEVTTSQTYMEDSLARHNLHRLKHGSPPLKLNPEMCKFSQYWANFLASRDTVMEHSQSPKCGENLFTGTRKGGYNASTPADRWYEEEKLYDYEKAEFKKGVGHFTAMVWKASRDMCTSSALSPTGKTFVVSEYMPRGNVVTRFKLNVPPPLSEQRTGRNDKNGTVVGPNGGGAGGAEERVPSLLHLAPPLLLAHASLTLFPH